MISVEQAYQHIFAAITPLDVERIASVDALGRILADDVSAKRDLPGFDNSAMDGFAVRASDLPGPLPVQEVIIAGSQPGELKVGHASKIMTGAVLPKGADAVVMKENAQLEGDQVSFATAVAQGKNVRRADSDMKTGDLLCCKGHPVELGNLVAMAAQGIASVNAYKRPRIAYLATGNELVPIGQHPGLGQVVNTTGVMAKEMLNTDIDQFLDLGIAGDDLQTLADKLADGIAQSDLVLTSGGVSVGDKDLVMPALEKLGAKIVFWKIAMKPGKPVLFAVAADGTPILGLPGNPVSSFVALHLFARAAVRHMMGHRAPKPRRFPAALAEDYAKRGDRCHFARARLESSSDGLIGRVIAKQGSGQLSSLLEVDALVEIPGDVEEISMGERVWAYPIRP